MISNLRRTYKTIESKSINRQIYNTLRGPFLKFCYRRNDFIDENICNCTTTCELTIHTDIKQKELTYHTYQMCSLTHKYKNVKDCVCTNYCSAEQNDLMLYFEIIKDVK